MGLLPASATPGVTRSRARPTGRAIAVASALILLLLAFFPILAWIDGAKVAMRDDWYRFLPGLFTQAGIAEETLFRGYLFRHYREGRGFWRAAWLSMIPFTAVHLLLLFTQPLPVALASILLAVVISFPLAWLFEIGRSTIWAPAVVHLVVQGALKLVDTPDDLMVTAAVGWIAVSAIVPYLAFAFRNPGASAALSPRSTRKSR